MQLHLKFDPDQKHQLDAIDSVVHLFDGLSRFAASVHPDTVAALHLLAEDILVCLDTALTEEAKISLADHYNLKVI